MAADSHKNIGAIEVFWSNETPCKPEIAKHQLHSNSKRVVTKVKEKSVNEKKLSGTTKQLDAIPAQASQPENNKPKQQATLKDLCTEDKERIANLVKELACLSEEKSKAEVQLVQERTIKEKQTQELMEQKEKIHLDQKEVEKQLRECQDLIDKYQIFLAKENKQRNTKTRDQECCTDELPTVNVEKRIDPVHFDQRLNRCENLAGHKSSSPDHVQLSSNLQTVHKLKSDHVDQLLLRNRGEVDHRSSSDHFSNSVEAKDESGFNHIHGNLHRFTNYVGYESFTNQPSLKPNDNNNPSVQADKRFQRFPAEQYKEPYDHYHTKTANLRDKVSERSEDRKSIPVRKDYAACPLKPPALSSTQLEEGLVFAEKKPLFPSSYESAQVRSNMQDTRNIETSHPPILTQDSWKSQSDYPTNSVDNRQLATSDHCRIPAFDGPERTLHSNQGTNYSFNRQNFPADLNRAFTENCRQDCQHPDRASKPSYTTYDSAYFGTNKQVATSRPTFQSPGFRSEDVRNVDQFSYQSGSQPDHLQQFLLHKQALMEEEDKLRLELESHENLIQKKQLELQRLRNAENLRSENQTGGSSTRRHIDPTKNCRMTERLHQIFADDKMLQQSPALDHRLDQRNIREKSVRMVDSATSPVRLQNNVSIQVGEQNRTHQNRTLAEENGTVRNRTLEDQNRTHQNRTLAEENGTVRNRTLEDQNRAHQSRTSEDQNRAHQSRISEDQNRTHQSRILEDQNRTHQSRTSEDQNRAHQSRTSEDQNRAHQNQISANQRMDSLSLSILEVISDIDDLNLSEAQHYSARNTKLPTFSNSGMKQNKSYHSDRFSIGQEFVKDERRALSENSSRKSRKNNYGNNSDLEEIDVLQEESQILEDVFFVLK